MRVMAALVAATHFPETNGLRQWMAGTSPAMTDLFWKESAEPICVAVRTLSLRTSGGP